MIVKSPVLDKDKRKETIIATYTDFNACMLSVHPLLNGCVLPAAFPIRPPQQCPGLFLALGDIKDFFKRTF